MKKLNGFDNYIINKAVKHWIDQVETEVLEYRFENDKVTIKKQRTNAKN